MQKEMIRRNLPSKSPRQERLQLVQKRLQWLKQSNEKCRHASGPIKPVSLLGSHWKVLGERNHDPTDDLKRPPLWLLCGGSVGCRVEVWRPGRTEL